MSIPALLHFFYNLFIFFNFFRVGKRTRHRVMYGGHGYLMVTFLSGGHGGGLFLGFFIYESRR